MDTLDELIDDALNLKGAKFYHSFVSNFAAKELTALDCGVFFAIKKRLENEKLPSLLAKPGLSGVLGSLFVLGNRSYSNELCEVLKTWPSQLVAPLLAQAPLALRGEVLSDSIKKLIEQLKVHPDSNVSLWANRFYER